jgi:hypothetical protein
MAWSTTGSAVAVLGATQAALPAIALTTGGTWTNSSM